MKGKKIDKEFVSEFISNCISKNINTPENIVSHANESINKINKEIKYIEKRKILRSKLLDVVYSFNINNSKSDNLSELKSLKFFNLKKPNVCQLICKEIKNNTLIALEEIDKLSSSKEDLLFCIKQLIEFKIIIKLNNNLIKGEYFDEYIEVILK